jgi:hypothetical protein
LVLAVVCATAVVACNREPLGSGDTCTRSSECENGLVCVEGACSGSLSGIGNPGTVPMLMEEQPPVEEAPDASMTMGGGGASGDASVPAGDAGLPDSGS